MSSSLHRAVVYDVLLCSRCVSCQLMVPADVQCQLFSTGFNSVLRLHVCHRLSAVSVDGQDHVSRTQIARRRFTARCYLTKEGRLKASHPDQTPERLEPKVLLLAEHRFMWHIHILLMMSSWFWAVCQQSACHQVEWSIHITVNRNTNRKLWEIMNNENNGNAMNVKSLSLTRLSEQNVHILSLFRNRFDMFALIMAPHRKLKISLVLTSLRRDEISSRDTRGPMRFNIIDSIYVYI